MQLNEKKKPQRTCVGCGKTFDKSDLLRVVRSPEGKISLDKKGKASGRGAYLCGDPECLKKAFKTKRLERNLGIQIPEEVYALLEEEVKNNG